MKIRQIQPPASGDAPPLASGSEVSMTLDQLQGAFAQHTGTMGRRPAAPAPAPTPVVEKSLAEQDPRFVEIGHVVPSKLAFYEFDTLAIRPFSLLEVQKMHRAISSGSLRLQIEAISSCLSVSALNLTWGDYQYVQYWLRINSYKKHPIAVPFVCTNPDHVQWAAAGCKPDPSNPDATIPVDQQSLKGTHLVQKDDLESRILQVSVANAYLEEFFKEYGLYLWSPLVSDLLEMETDLLAAQAAAQAQKLPEPEFDSTLDYINRFATMLNPIRHGKTLRERREFYQNMAQTASPDVASDMMQWEELAEHGVRQYVNPVCKECGQAVGDVPFRIDPLSFLPSA